MMSRLVGFGRWWWWWEEVSTYVQKSLWDELMEFHRCGLRGREAFFLGSRPHARRDLLQPLDEVLHGVGHVVRVEDLAKVPDDGTGWEDRTLTVTCERWLWAP